MDLDWTYENQIHAHPYKIVNFKKNGHIINTNYKILLSKYWKRT